MPGNARIDAAEIERRRRRYWAPYREAVAATIEAMLGERRAAGDPLDPFLHAVLARRCRGRGRSGVLWDADPRLPAPLIHALGQEPDIGAAAVGDNEPYDGALRGDTINAVATARGLSNALIEVRQDLIAEREAAEAWADRLARILAPLIASPAMRSPQDWGSRADGRGPASSPPASLPA